MGGRRQRLAVEAARARLLQLRGGGHGGRQRHEGAAALVQQPVQHHAQGVDVRLVAVGLVVVDLRRHVFVGADLGAAAGLLHRLGDAEVPQLVVPVLGDEDVLGLDVPVDDVAVLADHQGLAHILGQRMACASGAGPLRHLGQRRQQLHLDEDVPADARLLGVVDDIVTVDDVAVALHLGHELVLAHDVAQDVVEVAGDALLVIAVGDQLLHVARVMGTEGPSARPSRSCRRGHVGFRRRRRSCPHRFSARSPSWETL